MKRKLARSAIAAMAVAGSAIGAQSPLDLSRYEVVPANGHLVGGHLMYGPDDAGANCDELTGRVKIAYETKRAEDIAFCAEAVHCRLGQAIGLNAGMSFDGSSGEPTGYTNWVLSAEAYDSLNGSFDIHRLLHDINRLLDYTLWQSLQNDGHTYGSVVLTDPAEHRSARLSVAPDRDIFLRPISEDESYTPSMTEIKSFLLANLCTKSLAEAPGFSPYPRLYDMQRTYRFLHDKTSLALLDWASTGSTNSQVTTVIRPQHDEWHRVDDDIGLGSIASTNRQLYMVSQTNQDSSPPHQRYAAGGMPKIRLTARATDTVVHPVRISLTHLEGPEYPNADLNLFESTTVPERYIYMKRWYGFEHDGPFDWDDAGSAALWLNNFTPMQSPATFFRESEFQTDNEGDGVLSLYIPGGAVGNNVRFSHAMLIAKCWCEMVYTSFRERPESAGDGSMPTSGTEYQREWLGMALVDLGPADPANDRAMVPYGGYGSGLQMLAIHTRLADLAYRIFTSNSFKAIFSEAWMAYPFTGAGLPGSIGETSVWHYPVSRYFVDSAGYITYPTRSATVFLRFDVTPMAIVFLTDITGQTDLPTFKEQREREAAGLPISL